VNQIAFDEKSMILEVQRPHLILCGILILMSALTLLGPLCGVVFSIIKSGEFHAKYVMALVFASWIGIFILRFTLWNLFGKEHYTIKNGNIYYYTDYKLFKNKIKKISTENISFRSQLIGYEEDNKGILQIESDNGKIDSSIRIPLDQIESLIEKIKTAYNRVARPASK
jgi:hypothetical protein